jgi:hypothetical protein
MGARLWIWRLGAFFFARRADLLHRPFRPIARVFLRASTGRCDLIDSVDREKPTQRAFRGSVGE